jgi:hypothetical protein
VLTFHWITPLLHLGYQRPLQATDLWKMDASREAMPLAHSFLEHLDARQAKAAAWNAEHPTAKPRYGSLTWALNDTLTGFWSGGECKGRQR